jgi:hypothetical protein
MRNNTLWEKIKYRYEYLGQVEKEGEVYKKYKKVRRFPLSKKFITISLYLILILVVFAMANLFANLFMAGIGAKIDF